MSKRGIFHQLAHSKIEEQMKEERMHFDREVNRDIPPMLLFCPLVKTESLFELLKRSVKVSWQSSHVLFESGGISLSMTSSTAFHWRVED